MISAIVGRNAGAGAIEFRTGWESRLRAHQLRSTDWPPEHRRKASEGPLSVPLTCRAASSNLRVFVDFDGTIALEDTTDVILEHFAHPDWRNVEAEWIAGAIGSRECLVRQLHLVRVSPDALDAIADRVRLDRHFPEFVAFCEVHRIPVMVISDGLDRVVKRMLASVGMDLPVLANHLEWMLGDRWKLEFPHFSPSCRAAAGNCKCAALRNESGTMRILVGDGRSDFCCAEVADFVLAKGALAEHCRRKRLNYRAVGGFAGATLLLRNWIGELEDRGGASHDVEGSVHAPAS